jgi:hypothetical protein
MLAMEPLGTDEDLVPAEFAVRRDSPVMRNSPRQRTKTREKFLSPFGTIFPETTRAGQRPRDLPVDDGR